MTSNSVPAGADRPGDPRRLLADARGLARRVRLAQQVTWLPLLVLAVVTLGAIPVYRFTHPVLSDCRPIGSGQTCRAFWVTAQIYWWVGLSLAYVVIADGYLRVARARGLGSRVFPYVATGVVLVVLSAAMTGFMLLMPFDPDRQPSGSVKFLLWLFDPAGVIGLALIVLAWLERRVSLLLFALVYLVFVTVPITFGWGAGWNDRWGFAPKLVIDGGLLLLGSAGFALQQRFRSAR